MFFIKPQWVIFDVGGVIFDYETAFQEVANYLEIEKNEVADRVAQFRGDFEKGRLLFDEILKRVLIDLKKYHEYRRVYKLWWDIEKFLVGTKELVLA